MKIILTFKTPDVVDNAVDGALNPQSIRDTCAKWVEYGEYLRVEIDTVKGTCTPLPVG